MGQYYTPINLDREEYLYSHDYGSGLKLMEHSWVRNDFVETIGILLLKDNPWYKTRIIWAGDYTTEEDFPMPEKYKIKVLDLVRKRLKNNEYCYERPLEDLIAGVNIESIAEEYFTKITPHYVEGTLRLKDVVKYYFNETKKEYFDTSKVKAFNGSWRVHPLPLLTCTCNHSGGSYYGYEGESEEQKNLISSWKGDVIFSARDLDDIDVNKYYLIKPLFHE